LRAFDFNLTVMLGAKAHRAIFAEHADKLSARKGYSLLLPLIDDALLVSDGAHHAQQKRLVQPAFHTRRIESYLSIMHEAVLRRIDAWREGDVINVYEEARRMTLEAVMKALTGVDIRDQYETMASTITHLFDYHTKPSIQKWVRVDTPFTGYGKSLRARKTLDGLIYGLIADRRRNGLGDDMLSWLMEAREEDGSQLSDQQIRDQVLLLIYAGHDTATCTLAWALHLLGRHPAARQRVTEELSRMGPAAQLGMGALRGMPEMDMLIDETLRLYPPVWICLRGVTQSFVFDGVEIAEGSSLLFSAGASHRLPEVFEDPLTFNPQRFTPEQKSKLPQFSYIPYGGGAHMCVGMPFAQAELKVLLAHILSRWELTPVDDKPIPMHYNPTLAPKKGIFLRAKAL
jgi:cytochrome P450